MEGAAAVSNGLADGIKVLDGYQSSRAVQRVACLVPVGVVLAADDVQEVALGEAEVVVAVGGAVVVEGFNNLRKRCVLARVAISAI